MQGSPRSDGPSPTRAPQVAVDPDEVRRVIAELQEIGSDREYAEFVVEMLRDWDADPVDKAATQSEELAERTRAVLVGKIRQINDDLSNPGARRKLLARDPEWDRKAGRILRIIGTERRRLDAIIAGRAAEQGRVPNPPNPRRRAQERLWNMVLRGEPVTRSTPRDLLNDELAKVEAAKRARKEEARLARAEARGDVPRQGRSR